MISIFCPFNRLINDICMMKCCNLHLEIQRTQKPNYTVEQLSQKTHIPVIPPRTTILGRSCEREMKINTGQEVIFYNNSAQLFPDNSEGIKVYYAHFFTLFGFNFVLWSLVCLALLSWLQHSSVQWCGNWKCGVSLTLAALSKRCWMLSVAV